jgi:hypothetical protein
MANYGKVQAFDAPIRQPGWRGKERTPHAQLSRSSLTLSSRVFRFNKALTDVIRAVTRHGFIVIRVTGDRTTSQVKSQLTARFSTIGSTRANACNPLRRVCALNETTTGLENKTEISKGTLSNFRIFAQTRVEFRPVGVCARKGNGRGNQ